MTGSGESTFVIDKSADGSTTVGSDDESFDGSGSSVAEATAAVLITPGSAPGATSTVTSTDESEPEASEPPWVQVTS